MTAANSQVSVTPGVGADMATHTKNAKEHPLVVPADAFGHINFTADTFIVQTGNDANVANTTTIHFEMFNADPTGVIVEILGLYIIPTLTAVTGIGLTWDLHRTSAVGTGGSTLTPVKVDTAQGNLDADITARAKPTGGATSGDLLMTINTSSEETVPYASLASQLNHAGMLTLPLAKPIRLNQDEGIKLTKTTSSSVGSTNVICVFRVV